MLCERILEHSHDEESYMLESLGTEGRTRWKVTKLVRDYRSCNSHTQRGLALSNSEKVETLSRGLEVQLQAANEQSEPAVIEVQHRCCSCK
jgi:hypothetical protein